MVIFRFFKRLLGIKKNLIVVLIEAFNQDYGQIKSLDYKTLETNKLRSLWENYSSLINDLKKSSKDNDIYDHILVFDTAMMKLFADVTITNYVNSLKSVKNKNQVSSHCDDLAKIIIKGYSDKNNLVSIDKILGATKNSYSNPFLRDGHIFKSLNESDKQKLNEINVILEVLKKKTR